MLPLAALAACGPQIPATTSGLTVPAKLRFQPADTQAAWPDAAWWKGFRSPELDRLMAAAMAANYDIAAAEARVRQADAQLRITGAALLPTVSLGSSATRSQSSSSSSSSSRTQVGNSYNATVSASYEVDFWGKNRASTEAQRQTAISQRYDVGVVTLTAQSSVATTYFTIIATQEELAIQRENLAVAEHILQVIQAQAAAGTATGLDVAQQQTVVAQQRADIPTLQQTIDQNIAALAVLVALPPEQLHITGGDLATVVVPPVAPGLPAEVLTRRPDVLEAEANLAADNASVAAARAALLPSVSLTAEGGYASTVLSSLIRPESQLFSLASSLTQPIFEGGQLRAQVRLSQAQAEELLATYRKTILTALQETDSGLVGLTQMRQQYELQQAAAVSADRAYQISEGQLRAGTINILTLLSTQQTLFSARNSAVTAHLSYLSAAVTLFTALGGGWQAPPMPPSNLLRNLAPMPEHPQPPAPNTLPILEPKP